MCLRQRQHVLIPSFRSLPQMSVNRPATINDTRVHCCLYFIAPTGHGCAGKLMRPSCCLCYVRPHQPYFLFSTPFSLKPLDIELMRRLHHLVNIVPVIAKADALTLEERAAFRARVSTVLRG